MRWSGGFLEVGRAVEGPSSPVTASAFPGSATPAGSARTAGAAPRTCAWPRASPATTLDGGYAERMLADARYLPAAVRGTRGRAGTVAVRRTDRLSGLSRRRGRREPRTLRLRRRGAPARAGRTARGPAGVRVHAPRGPPDAQRFARELGAVWAAGSGEPPPEPLDAAILFAPVGALIPAALAAVRPGGRVVCAGIHMSDVPAFPYRLLWGERCVSSVANLTRRDGQEFLRARRTSEAAPSRVERFALGEAERALERLRSGGGR